jgi:hypothetical protein
VGWTPDGDALLVLRSPVGIDGISAGSLQMQLWRIPLDPAAGGPELLLSGLNGLMFSVALQPTP